MSVSLFVLLQCPGLLSTKTISETDVFNQVSQLFKDQPDLLPEFSKFLPDADVSSSFRAGDNFPTSSSPDVSTFIHYADLYNAHSRLLSAPHAPPSKLSYDEYTDSTLSVGR